MAIFENKNATVVISKQFTGSTLESTTGYCPVFSPELGAYYQVQSVTERHSIIGSSTLMLVAAPGTTPMNSTAFLLLASTLDLTSTINIPNYGTVLGSAVLSGSTPFGTTATGPIIGPGDAIGWRFTTAGNYSGVGEAIVVLARL